MDEYDCVRKSSLKFKGEKRKKKHKGSSKDKEKDRTESQLNESGNNERLEDAENHGGWWKVENYEFIKDDIAIEFLDGCYIKAVSNGTIVLGNPHPPGEGPDEEEIFTAIPVGSGKFAIKSGFGRYLSVDTRKRLMGLSEAISEQESFLPVFESGKSALCANNDCFISPEEGRDDQQIVARSETAGPNEMLSLRINHDPQMFNKKRSNISTPQEDSGTLYETELGYLKKYQSHGQRHFNLREDKKDLKKARLEGQLHEALLEKRVKSKSDKYCK